MDVDNGTSSFLSFLSRTYKFAFLETPVIIQDSTKKVRLIPYRLVPGMATNSRLFHKAQATISKQATAASPSSKASVERLFQLEQSTSPLFQF